MHLFRALARRFSLYFPIMIKLVCMVLLLSPPAITQTAEAGLRQVLDDQTAAWNRGVLAGGMQGYWHAADLTFFAGNAIMRGWVPTLQRSRDKYQGDVSEMGQLSFS